MVSSTRDVRYVLLRLTWAVAVIWLVLTLTYAVLRLVPDTRLAGFATVEMGIGAVADSTGNPFEMYLDWMWAFLTLNWGKSIYYDTSVVSLYVTRLPVTLAYVVPGLLTSVVIGLGVSTYAAVKPDSLLNRTLSTVSYVGLSIPAFVAAELFFWYAPSLLNWVYVYNPELGLWHPRTFIRLLVPTAIVALSMSAVQIRHAQTATVDHLDEEFVKSVRSKGASRGRIARHIFRNTWPTMVSIVLGEAFGLLILTTIVVERILELPGIAAAVFNGFGAADPMLSFTAVFGLVFLGVFGTLVRDFARLAFDPRVDS